MKRIHSISWFEPSDCGLGRGVRLLSAAPEVRGDAHSHLTKENTCPILSQVVSHCSANVAGHLHFLTCPLLIYIIHSYQTVAIFSNSLHWFRDTHLRGSGIPRWRYWNLPVNVGDIEMQVRSLGGKIP